MDLEFHTYYLGYNIFFLGLRNHSLLIMILST
jgi:hypothetical protein